MVDGFVFFTCGWIFKHGMFIVQNVARLRHTANACGNNLLQWKKYGTIGSIRHETNYALSNNSSVSTISMGIKTSFSFPDPKVTERKKRRVQRTLGMIPGLLTWSTLIGMLVFSFFSRIVFVSYYSLKGHWLLLQHKRIDWWERCQNIADPQQYVRLLEERRIAIKDILRQTQWWNVRACIALLRRHRKITKHLVQVRALIPRANDIMDWREVVHVILLPTAGEPAEIIEPAIQYLADANFPKSQMIVLLATEEREDLSTRLPKVEYLTKKFSGVFRDFLVTTHVVAAGEMKCKASNATFAAKELMKYLDEKKIDYTRVLFSNFDCDTVAHPEYFAALTYA